MKSHGTTNGILHPDLAQSKGMLASGSRPISNTILHGAVAVAGAVVVVGSATIVDDDDDDDDEEISFSLLPALLLRISSIFGMLLVVGGVAVVGS